MTFTSVISSPSFRFGTKAGTLDHLSKIVTRAILCDQFFTTVRQWNQTPSHVLETIVDRFAPARVAVRSSSQNEDTYGVSNAGAFESVTNVPCSTTSLADAIETVIASYGKASDDDEVLIQPMVEGVALSGVVFTRDLDTGAPYYVINYDDLSGRTDTVTGGAISKTVAVHRANQGALHSPRMRKLIEAIQEIESLTGYSELDIEFCITLEELVYILQVRPLTMHNRWQIVPDAVIDQEISEIRKQISKRMAKVEGICGSTTILGEMPDWNPAEMIGSAPRPQALSLYKYLITDETWSEARRLMGYRSVAHPLLITYAGRPYIDVRLSLNSFVPAALDDGLVERIVDGQLETLADSKELHDKIEFEISITCRDFNFNERRTSLLRSGYSKSDVENFEEALTELTSNAIAAGPENLLQILSRTDAASDTIASSDSRDNLDQAKLLLQDCIPYGTLPFSILARHGFIAVSLLRSMVDQHILSAAESEQFLNSIHTVATDIVRDIARAAHGDIELDAFLSQYGHLRPGTYDILSWRYDEKPELYIGSARKSPKIVLSEPSRFQLSSKQEEMLLASLREHQLPADPARLLEYIRCAIFAREQAKFAFTRYLSDALLALGTWGNEVGLSREELSYLEISDLFEFPNDIGYLKQRIDHARSRYLVTQAIRLPHLIVEPDDIDVVRDVVGQPTFVTSKSVTEQMVYLSTNTSPYLQNKIVLIESADPGFDWIFSHDIAGLVTKYGGSNSHMAIRCAEFGLPAAIGCGEKLYRKLMGSSVIELNCAARTISGH